VRRGLHGLIGVLLSASALLPAGGVAAGWSSWETTPPAGTRRWCCGSGPDGSWRARGCELRTGASRTGVHARIDVDGNGPVRVYVRHDGARLRDVEVYAADCPVRSTAAITDRGTLPVAQSLAQIVEADLDHERLYPALAAHGLPAAPVLRERAEQATGEAGEQAWFWYAIVAPPEAEAVLQTALRRSKAEPDPLIIALAQLPTPRSTRALLAVLRDPQHSLAARKQTLFWLGQSEDPDAHRAVADLLD